MRAIIIGAGRGSRLLHETDEIPKTLVPVMGRPMLDWILDAMKPSGITRRDIVFICGYKSNVIKSRYPEFTFVDNADWENNNILLSLMYARDYFDQDFVMSYADIVYRPEIIERVIAHAGDIVLGCDTDWRRRYLDRSQHPESDGEKLRAEGDRVVELSRRIAAPQASGEFIGVAKITRAGATRISVAFDQAARVYTGKAYREGRSFEKAYLIDHFAHMLDAGETIFRANIHGGYMELDTLQDLAFAQKWWDGYLP